MKFLKWMAAFCFGGLCYGALEILWRSETHISMFFAGGLCFLAIYLTDESGLFGGSMLLQAPFCAMVITAVELAFGEVVNRAMGLGVWDYSELPLNFMGQICLPFSAIWLALSFPALLAARVLRTAMFGEKFVRPRLGVRIKRHEEAKRESI